MRPTVILLVTLLFVAVLPGCGGGADAPAAPPPYAYAAPPDTGDGWSTGHLSDVGMDVGLMEALIERIRDGGYRNIHSVLLVKDGRLVLEEYFEGTNRRGRRIGYHRGTLHELHSVTKSVNSALIGIAIGQQLISGVDARILDLYPQHADLFTDPRKQEIRLEHFLTMNAGLEWDEWSFPYTDPRNDHVQMNNSADQIRFVLGRPLADDPGTRFVYNSGVSICLGGIIPNVSTLYAHEFAEEYLFRPLGITSYSWSRYPNGTVQTGGGLQLRPRDMAKIGFLFINGGRWGAEQVVPESWVTESTAVQASDQSPDFDYGYQWWLRTFQVGGQSVRTVSADGRGGQFIFLVPSLDMVAVFTGWNDNARATQAYEMLEFYVLTAVLSP